MDNHPTNPPTKDNNLVGQRFGRLLVLAEADRKLRKMKDRKSWICVCDCGAFSVRPTMRLQSGAVKSCGCLQRNLFNFSNPKSRPKPVKAPIEVPKREPDALDFLFAARRPTIATISTDQEEL